MIREEFAGDGAGFKMRVYRTNINQTSILFHRQTLNNGYSSGRVHFHKNHFLASIFVLDNPSLYFLKGKTICTSLDITTP